VSVALAVRPYRPVDWEALLRDLRHMDAAASDDLADWLVHLELEGKRPKTLYVYERQVSPLLRAHPGKRVDAFTHSDVNDVLRRVPRRSRHITRSILNGWFEWARVDGRIDRSPMDRVPRIPAQKRRPSDIFTEAEASQLESLPAPDGALWALLFGSGIRRGEARNLRRSNIDLSRGLLHVIDGKGGRDRFVPLPVGLLATLDELVTLEGIGPDEYFWYTRPGGRARVSRRDPIADSTFERWYRAGIEQAGVRYLNPHQTRHTYGHRLREKGFDLEERQLLMGHEDVQTTQRYYGHLTIEDVARKVALLG
jgi:integrase/recombinase XerD